MRRALDETSRRREKQLRFNEEHGIVPQGVKKEVRDLIDGVYVPPETPSAGTGDAAKLEAMGEKQVAKEIKKLEKAMLEYARNLEFEKAARARDQLLALKEKLFGAGGRHADEEALSAPDGGA